MNLLAPWAVDVASRGRVKVGMSDMPSWMAVELADRLLLAAEVARGDVDRRRKVREHLDRIFAGAGPIRVRQVGVSLAYNAIGFLVQQKPNDRATVRLGWYATAQLRREGERWRGFVMEWDWDGLFGPVSTCSEEFLRVSAAQTAVTALPRLQLEGS